MVYSGKWPETRRGRYTSMLVVFGDRRPLSTLEFGDCSDGRIDSTSERISDALTKLDQPIQECGGTGRGASSRITMPSVVMPGWLFRHSINRITLRRLSRSSVPTKSRSSSTSSRSTVSTALREPGPM